MRKSEFGSRLHDSVRVFTFTAKHQLDQNKGDKVKEGRPVH